VLRNLPIRLIDPDMAPPARAHPDDAGLDLRSRIEFTVEPGAWISVPTGIAIEIPRGYVGLVVPRSGLALDHGVTVLNSPGIVDPGYTGEVAVVLINTHPARPHVVNRGDRIAQLIISMVLMPHLVFKESLGQTLRGPKGFGDSGT
jgi:dUTP pyrophosphatase